MTEYTFQVTLVASIRVKAVTTADAEHKLREALRHMRKGVSPIANVAFLKYCAIHNIKPSWILLTGFPCETEEDYAWNIRVCTLIRHLVPPQICAEIRIDRFSPNHKDPVGFGFGSIEPIKSYSSIYDEQSVRLEEIAYFFEPTTQIGRGLARYKDQLNTLIENWQSKYLENDLWCIGTGSEDVVVDSRSSGEDPKVWLLDDINAAIVRRADTRTSVETLNGLVGKALAATRIAKLEEVGLLLQESGSIISLPLRLDHTKRRPSKRSYNAVVATGRAVRQQNVETLELMFEDSFDCGLAAIKRRTQR